MKFFRRVAVAVTFVSTLALVLAPVMAQDVNLGDTPRWFRLYVSGSVSATGNNAWTGTNSFIDGNFSIIGSADATKFTKFEVDGSNAVMYPKSATAGVDTNTAGQGVTIRAGTGTGTGTPSTIAFDAPKAVASGTGAQTLETVMTIENLSSYGLIKSPAGQGIWYKTSVGFGGTTTPLIFWYVGDNNWNFGTSASFWGTAYNSPLVGMSYDSSNIVKLHGSTTTAAGCQKRLGDANGGYVLECSATELLTLATGATTTDTNANLLPADAIIDSVVTRVTTTITTAVSFSVGDPTTAARFSASAGGMTAGSTRVGLDHMKGSVTTDAAGPTQAAAAKVRITTNANPGAGAIRITVFYRQFVAPTS
jgi:hypothetical protein